MTKEEFLSALQERLAGLPSEDIRKSVDYYREMIDDRIEDGMSEEEAVAAVGTLDEVVSQILSDVPLSRIVKNRSKERKKRDWSPWVIVLLILGSPVWASLLFAAVITIFSLLFALGATLISLVVAGVALIPAGFSAMITGAFAAASGGSASMLLVGIGGGLFCIGLSILWVLVCVKLLVLLYKGLKALVLWIKNRCVGKSKESEGTTV